MPGQPDESTASAGEACGCHDDHHDHDHGDGHECGATTSATRAGDREELGLLLADEALQRDVPPEIDRRVLFGTLVVKRVPLFDALGLASGVVVGAAAYLVAPNIGLALFLAALTPFAALFFRTYAPMFRAARLRRAGKTEAALETLNDAGRRLGNPDAYLPLRAAILIQSGYPAEAVEIIRARAKFLDGRARDEVDERLATALVLVEKDLDEAEKLFREALARDPSRHELRANHGMCCYMLERYDEAAKSLELASRHIEGMRGARRANLFFALGDSFFNLGRKKEAAPWFKKSREWMEKERAERLAAGRNSTR